MNATIWLKGKDGGHEHLAHCQFEDTEWERLKADWLAYLENGKPVGGAYRYVSRDAGSNKDPRDLLLKFENIAAVK